jgi:hypothetical protein
VLKQVRLLVRKLSRREKREDAAVHQANDESYFTVRTPREPPETPTQIEENGMINIQQQQLI